MWGCALLWVLSPSCAPAPLLGHGTSCSFCCLRAFTLQKRFEAPMSFNCFQAKLGLAMAVPWLCAPAGMQQWPWAPWRGKGQQTPSSLGPHPARGAAQSQAGVGAGWSSLGLESCHHSWQHPQIHCCCSRLFLSVQERKKKHLCKIQAWTLLKAFE